MIKKIIKYISYYKIFVSLKKNANNIFKIIWK